MKTDHVSEANLPDTFPRPASVPFMRPGNLVKGKFQEGERKCMTGWMLDTFLPVDGTPYVCAYREFRCKMMDVMYLNYSEDHASTPEQRSELWNTVAEELGYQQKVLCPSHGDTMRIVDASSFVAPSYKCSVEGCEETFTDW